MSRRPPRITPPDELRAFDGGADAGPPQTHALEDGERVPLAGADEPTLRSAIQRLDDDRFPGVDIAVELPGAIRVMFVSGGNQDLVVVSWIDGCDLTDPTLHVLDLGADTDESMDQNDGTGEPSGFLRRQCVDKSTALRAALYFARTAAPDPGLTWGE